MASLGHREDERPALAPQSPHFFKIILPETLVQEKLKIPKKFVRKYGNTLLDSISLEVPSGRVWKIDLTRYDNGEVWLETGWKPFVGYYSLSPGHLVAFRYEGSSKFSVFIYDVGASEINYQPHNTRGEALNMPKIEEGDKVAISVENINESNLQTLPQKRKRTTSTSETDIGGNVLNPISSECIHKATQSDRFAELEKSKVSKSMKTFTSDEKFRALERASGFKTENPCFKVLLQPSYINPGTKLCIPAIFVHRHFTQKAGNVTLSTSDGRIWLAKYKVDKGKNAILYNGWRVFVKDNGMKSGDVCVFELIKSTEVFLKVVIFRETFDENHPISQVDEADVAKQKKTKDLKTLKSESDTYVYPCEKQDIEGTQRAINLQIAHQQELQSKGYGSTEPSTSKQRATNLQKAKAFKPGSPFFMVVMQRSHIDKWFKLNVPLKFACRHFTHGNGDVILFTSDGGAWPAKYRFNVRNTKRSAELRLCCGWKAFAKDNGLQVGDVCVFELKRGIKVILKVVIFRENDNTNPPSSQVHGGIADKVELKRSMVQEPEMKVRYEDANSVDKFKGCFEGDCEQSGHQDKASCGKRPSCSSFPRTLKTVGEKYPSFQVVISSSHVRHASLNVPISFSRKLIKNGSCTLKLQVGDRVWPVKLVEYRKHKKQVLSKGFMSFVKQNAIRAGDICKFVLTNENDAIFQVSISRVSS